MMMLPEQYDIVLINADREKQQGFLGSRGAGETHRNDGSGQEHASTTLSSE